MSNKKYYVFTFVEEVTSQVKIEAQTEDEARKIIEEGNFTNEEILDRNHLEILDSKHMSRWYGLKPKNP
tara:strand:- start:302 stop:508 length:207 start_codon:yes stop_codon:yes gene_type:complete